MKQYVNMLFIISFEELTDVRKIKVSAMKMGAQVMQQQIKQIKINDIDVRNSLYCITIM